MDWGRVREFRFADIDGRDVLILCIGLAAIYVSGWNIDGHALLRWDEGIYAEVGRLAAHQGHLIVPYIQGGLGGINPHPFLEKPPALFWAIAGSISVFGPTAFAVRVPTILSTVGIALIIYILGEEWGSRLGGATAAGVFLTSPYVFAGRNAARNAGADMMLVFFGTVFIAGVTTIVRDGENGLLNRYSHLLVGAGAVGAVLTKGAAFGVYAIVALPVLLVGWRRVDWRRFAKTVSISVAVTLPWFLVMLFLHGDAFVQEFFIEMVVERASKTNGHYGAMFPFMDFPYILASRVHLDPYYYLLPFAIPFSVGLWGRTRDPLNLIVPWWICAVFVFFTLTGDHPWYLLPLYPAVGLLLGDLVDTAATGDLMARVLLFLTAPFMALKSARIATPINGWGLGNVMPGALAGPEASAIFAGLIGAIVFWPSIKTRLPETTTTSTFRSIATGALVLLVVFTLVSPPPVTDSLSTDIRTLGEETDEVTGPEETVYVDQNLHGSVSLWSFSFYGQVELEKSTIAEIRDLDQGELALVSGSTTNQISRGYSVVSEVKTSRGKLTVIKY